MTTTILKWELMLSENGVYVHTRPTMATIRHVGRWLHQQRPLLAGDPLAQVKDLQADAPDWNGLTSRASSTKLLV